MKRIYLLLSVIFCASLSFAQNRTCPSTVNLDEMQVSDPDRYQRFINLETFTANYIASRNSARIIDQNGIITIPVVVHVLHSGEAEGSGKNISFNQIQSQIDVLNEDFRRLNGDRGNTPAAFTGVAADVGFEFRLACIDPNGNTTNGVVRRNTGRGGYTLQRTAAGTPDENAMGIKMTNIAGDNPWPTDRYLNIWVCNFTDNLLGYATFPADFAANPNVDGVVITTSAFGRTGFVTAPFDRGRTATHEIGHWLNLRHIWGDANCGNDAVGDTPQQLRANLGCPGFPHTSGCAGNGPNGDMFMNYMDYTDDGCMNIFTNGQRLRARAVFEPGGPRSAFLNNYFRIQPPLTTISCSGRIVASSLCLPANWTITSGPAVITEGQGTNAVTVKATGSGTVHLVATMGNYTDEIDFNIDFTLPPNPIPGIFTTNNYTKGIERCNVLTGQFASGKYNGFVAFNSPSTTHFNWTFVSASTGTAAILLASADGRSAEIRVYPRGGLGVWRVAATNACGTSVNNFGFYADKACPIERIATNTDNNGSDAAVTDELITLSPNPAINQITIAINKDLVNIPTLNNVGTDQINAVRIFDVMGRLRKQQRYNKATNVTINVSDLNNGIYFVEIINGKTSIKRNLRIMR